MRKLPHACADDVTLLIPSASFGHGPLHAAHEEFWQRWDWNIACGPLMTIVSNVTLDMANSLSCLLEWFHSHDGFTHEAITLEVVGECCRGVVVQQPGISADDVILSVPAHSRCILRASNASLSAVNDVLEDDDYSDWWSLSLLTLHELYTADSPWQPLFHAAPSSYTSALYWTDSDFSYARGAGQSWLLEKSLHEQLKVSFKLLNKFDSLFFVFSPARSTSVSHHEIALTMS